MLSNAIDSLNIVATHWADWVLVTGLNTAGLLIVVGMVWLVIRRHVSPQIGYWLFLLVPLKVLVPVQWTLPMLFLETAASTPNPATRAIAPVGTSNASQIGAPGFNTPRIDARQFESPLHPVEATSKVTPVVAPQPGFSVPKSVPATDNVVTVRPAEPVPRPTYLAIAMLLWLAGVLFLVARWLIRETRFRSRLRHASRNALTGYPANLAALAGLAGVSRRVRFVKSDAISAPAVAGLFRPVVILPCGLADALTPAQIEWAVLHELAHIRRRDLFAILLQRLAAILHLFNPAIWIANRVAHRLREYACDDLASQWAGHSSADASESFVNVLRYASARSDKRVYGLGILGLDAHAACRQRLRRMLDQHGRIISRPGRWSAVALILVALAALPNLRAGQVEVNQAEANGPAESPTAESTIPGRKAAAENSSKPEEIANREDDAPEVSADQSTDDNVAAGNARLAEIIREVRKNEALYENLETVHRKVKQLKLEDNPTKWSITHIEEKWHTAWQGALIYFHGDETQTRISGEKVRNERVSAFDGEQTRTVDYGNSANVHEGRHESQYVYPPHCWVLINQRVNFPLSTLLRGTEAIQKHPKVHDYPRERGSVFEFNRFEAEYVGEDKVNGLNCVKILCRRWHYTRDDPAKSHIWLAPERNYLCVKYEDIPRDAKSPPRTLAIVDSFREITDGIWLPERVSVLRYYREDLRNGKQTIEWEDTLELVEASLNPGRPVEFFSEIEIPDELPVFHIADGELAGHDFRLRQPTADSEERVREIIEKIRIEEERYRDLEVVAEETYQDANVENMGIDGFVTTNSKTTSEHSIQADGKLWYAAEETSRGIDGSESKSHTEEAFDGEWARSYRDRQRKVGEKISGSRYASLSREGGGSIEAHLPHMLFFRGDGQDRLFSEFLSSPWGDIVNRYPHRIDYLGEDERDGLRCVVLRKAFIPEGETEILMYRLMWLAVDRNYLPVHFEWYEPDWCPELPTGTVTAGDWREIAPGLWFPFNVSSLAFQKWDTADLSVGRVLLNWKQTLNVSKAVINPEFDERLFEGPEVPVGTQVQLTSATGLFLGEFKQDETGRLEISEEKFVEMLNTANEREREKERRKEAMDALIGKPAPAFPASKWLNSSAKAWDDLKGKVVVVDFWADWCGPCRPDLERLAELYAYQDEESKAEMAIIGIHTAGSKLADIEKVMKEYDVEYPIFVDPAPTSGDGWGELFNAFEVHSIPQTFVVDADGKIAAYGRLEEMVSKAGQLVDKESERKKVP